MARRILRLLLAGIVVIVSIGVAVGTTVVLAGASAAPAAFLSGGWLVLALGVAAATLLVSRGADDAQRVRTVVPAVAVATAIAAGAVLPSLGDPRTPPIGVPGMRFAELATGSRLAYVRVPASPPSAGATVVFLHGGPGTADMHGDQAFFTDLTAAGHEVLLYDQIGAGHSSRLEDPTAYSLERDLADLEALLAALDVERPILVGHSYGATLAAAYLARHPAGAARAVLLAPGAIREHRLDYGTGMVDRLTSAQRLELYGALLQPRALLGWLLSQVDVRAAHAFADDAEMDARFDRTYALSVPGLYCVPPTDPPPVHGLGFYTNAVRRRIPDLRAALAAVDIPVLIVKPQCDYLPWSFGTDLARSLPNARLVYLPGAGHSLYAERPDAVRSLLRAFLADRPLPIAPLDDLAPPADLRGPVGDDDSRHAHGDGPRSR
jgi:proline iminopeptidase